MFPTLYLSSSFSSSSTVRGMRRIANPSTTQKRGRERMSKMKIMHIISPSFSTLSLSFIHLSLSLYISFSPSISFSFYLFLSNKHTLVFPSSISSPPSGIFFTHLSLHFLQTPRTFLCRSEKRRNKIINK